MTANDAKLYLTDLWESDWTSVDETIALEMAIKALTAIEDIKAEIEKQIERDFAFAENENVKVPCHYGTANGLQVALRIIDGVIGKHINGKESE